MIPVAIRNPFAYTRTAAVVDADESEWERIRLEMLKQHKRDRDLWIEDGAKLGPITYTETRGNESGDWSGEWRSEIQRLRV